MLDPELQEKATTLKESLPFELLIYCTIRTAEEQAILWRQSRPLKVIEAKINTLIKYGHLELAELLKEVGPRSGPAETHSGPGESWHQYGLAFKAVPIKRGVLLTNVHKYKQEWLIVGQTALDLGLNWGGNWPKWANYPHFQLPMTGNPLKLNQPGCIMK